ncbi:predicted protein [Postia placenta Mad-698-R]|uniref:Uncharacterized protein n=1 Tax=Postia placenta MAD-698-R-SB12 TaxID=670580 RepID=A0A1X6N5J4_9APHY|nr:hypothetical protein POSPLADRAFT_1045047 [Postia placenta MAD-698-R-SB12]EED81240.1 predicted protein [Postia placenta Mad-698-R]OSX63877.1 hypothetical protein POSPLADRAFT_1045047 [Postia placenta MAD-698-R-SB12]
MENRNNQPAPSVGTESSDIEHLSSGNASQLPSPATDNTQDTSQLGARPGRAMHINALPNEILEEIFFHNMLSHKRNDEPEDFMGLQAMEIGHVLLFTTLDSLIDASHDDNIITSAELLLYNLYRIRSLKLVACPADLAIFDTYVGDCTSVPLLQSLCIEGFMPFPERVLLMPMPRLIGYWTRRLCRLECNDIPFPWHIVRSPFTELEELCLAGECVLPPYLIVVMHSLRQLKQLKVLKTWNILPHQLNFPSNVVREIPPVSWPHLRWLELAENATAVAIFLSHVQIPKDIPIAINAATASRGIIGDQVRALNCLDRHLSLGPDEIETLHIEQDTQH